MNIIDAHIHTNFPRKDWEAIAKKNKIDLSMLGLVNEMKDSNVVHALTITDSFDEPTPMGKLMLVEQLRQNNKLSGIIGINSDQITPTGIAAIRDLLAKKVICGIKIFLGYYHTFPFDERYTPIYALAEEFGCPVMFHTGDTLSSARHASLVKYAHPIHLDEVAVKWPKVKIIIAHAGYPWIIDAAEVAYKNPNVYVDVSGWACGHALNPHNPDYLSQIIEYCGPQKVIYGSDWPLVRMNDYIAFVKKSIPRKYWKDVFYNNAVRVFGLPLTLT